ncbi:MAG TPA: alpha/beta hydrolase [Candidatus Sulfotelmatobacter sp.]|nr:alpha/beta hydrolase [Candidatus Sulfotelmatobacter sp.]
MSTYLLLHGAGSSSWYWYRVTPELQERGHEVFAVDLPCDDDAAGLAEYADAAIRAVGNPKELIVVAQSLAGFTAPLLCGRLRVILLVLINAMVPVPGETAGQWWANTGHVFPEPFDPVEVFLHDVTPEIAAESANHVRRQSDSIFEQPWPLAAWPQVPTRYLLCRDDRLFSADFQRKVAHERLGITPDEMPGGHLPALAHPRELVRRLEAYRAEVETGELA